MVAPKRRGRYKWKHNFVDKKFKTWKIPSFELLRQQFGGKFKKISKKVFKNNQKCRKKKR
jgi:hypothetical protein